MRYMLHVLHSPRLVLQLLLLLTLAGLIGGAGLRGLITARSTLRDISSGQLPGLVHLLDSERDIAHAENLGYRALLNADPAHLKPPAEIPEILSLIRQSWDNYQAFKAAGPHPADQSALMSSIDAHFSVLLLAAVTAEPLGRAKIGIATGVQILQQADAQIVTPLQASLTQLAKLDENEVTAGGGTAADSAAAAAALLLGVILGTLAIACMFQIAIDSRGHRACALSHLSADLVLIIDDLGIVRHASLSFQRVLGRAPGAMIGRSIEDFVHRDEVDEIAAHVNRLANADGSSVSTSVRALHADGTFRWLEIAAISHIRDPLLRGIVITARDVTKRKEAELRLHAVLTHAPIALFAIDAAGTFSYYREGVPFMPGSDARGVEGTPVESWQTEAPHLHEIWAHARGGEQFPLIVDVDERVFEVWWTPEPDAAGSSEGTGVAVDVTATVRARREAERARVAAVEVASMRSDFVAAVSHELRTPLTAIIGYGELLEDRWELLDDAYRKVRITRIVEAANRQLRLVEDLLLTTRLDDDLALLQPAPVSVAALVASVSGELMGKYPDQRIALQGLERLRAFADGDAVKQVLTNLVDNAAKYSDEGSPVTVSWRLDGDTVQIRVHDEGSGISEEYRSLLFTRFGRIHGSRIRSGHVGTGLGLYLGRRLARAMGGDLELESTGPAGSVFLLSLPHDRPVAGPTAEVGLPAHTLLSPSQ